MRRVPALARMLASILCLVVIAFCTTVGGDERQTGQDKARAAVDSASVDPASVAPRANITVQLILDRAVYGKTRYKNPPQFAVWVEDMKTGDVRTLYVSQKMGRGTWNGKPTVPVSLPFWVSRHNKATGTKGDPRRDQPLPDAITQPTPTEKLQLSTQVSRDRTWACYVEVNVSGDYNDTFALDQPDGTEDTYGNGQPSLVYRAKLDPQAKEQLAFKIVGRTQQLKPSPKLSSDLKGITTAKRLFSRMRVTIVPVGL